jgi:hypothetical protein
MMFFDNKNKFRGSARVVTCREPAISGLSVLDVSGADKDLIAFLTYLDRRAMLIQHPNSGDEVFRFRWASGYQNGDEFRVQGMLEHA